MGGSAIFHPVTHFDDASLAITALMPQADADVTQRTQAQWGRFSHRNLACIRFIRMPDPLSTDRKSWDITMSLLIGF